MVGFHWAYQASLQAKYTYLLNIFLENSFFFTFFYVWTYADIQTKLFFSPSYSSTKTFYS